jgi:hypothetical protein
VRRRWLVGSVATATLVAGTAVAAVAVRDRQDGSPAADRAAGTASALDAASATPTPGRTTSPGPTSPGTTSATPSTRPAAATAKP